MKEKWTKLGKSLICLALVTSMLAGCGGGGNSSSSSEKQTSGGTSGEVATGDDNFNETGLPIVKEPVELTFLYVKGANTMDFKDNVMFQLHPRLQRTDLCLQAENFRAVVRTLFPQRVDARGNF